MPLNSASCSRKSATSKNVGTFVFEHKKEKPEEINTRAFPSADFGVSLHSFGMGAGAAPPPGSNIFGMRSSAAGSLGNAAWGSVWYQ